MSIIESLMEFQRRVLFQARNASMKDRLFFTNIFMSNTNEMFQKYDMRPVMNKYIDEVGECINNYEQVLAGLNENETIIIDDSDSFERRHNSVFRIGNNARDIRIDYSYYRSDVCNCLRENDIYYMLINFNMNPKIINFKHIDMKHSLYSEPFSSTINGITNYWPIVETIRKFYETDDTKVVAIKVTKSLRVSRECGDDGNTCSYHEITKVEYSGETDAMMRVKDIFGDALIIRNPCLYTKDIEFIVNKLYPSPVEKQVYRPIKTLDLMDDDILIEYPNDTFDDYLQFLKSAVDNKETKSIYMTIYRIGKDPAIYYILRDAVNKGIDVTVNIELMARGDEVDNVVWMEEFQRVGIKVLTYRKFVMKIHCKLTLVEFHNGKSVAQIGTGNYHTKTSTQYTDLNLITSDDEICSNIKKVFTKLFKEKPVLFNNDSFLVTTHNFMRVFSKLVNEQIRLGENGYICIKCNTLYDANVEDLLQKAADAGVKIDLIIRGACTWCPMQLGKNVTIKSIVWDKLEHSRVMCFGSNNPKIYIGSLDLVKSKLQRRIETMVLVTSPNIIVQMCNYLNRYITTTIGSWKMQPNGTYRKENER